MTDCPECGAVNASPAPDGVTVSPRAPSSLPPARPGGVAPCVVPGNACTVIMITRAGMVTCMSLYSIRPRQRTGPLHPRTRNPRQQQRPKPQKRHRMTDWLTRDAEQFHCATCNTVSPTAPCGSCIAPKACGSPNPSPPLCISQMNGSRATTDGAELGRGRSLRSARRTRARAQAAVTTVARPRMGSERGILLDGGVGQRGGRPAQWAACMRLHRPARRAPTLASPPRQPHPARSGPP